MKQIINKRFNSLRRILLALAGALLATLPSACSDRDDEALSPTDSATIHLLVSAPGENEGAVTRAKTFFATGDVIWVDATFKTANITSEVKTYKLTLNGEGKWLVGKYGDFSWPQGATSGSFKAYFIENEDLSESSLSMDLSSFTDEEGHDDPLYAETGEIAAGGAVHLLFAHTLTKLYISGLAKATTEVTLKGISTSSLTFTPGVGYGYLAAAGDVKVPVKEGKAVLFLHVIDKGTPSLEVLPAVDGDDLTLNEGIVGRMKAMQAGRAYLLNFGAGGANVSLTTLGQWWQERLSCVPAIKLDANQIQDFFTALAAGNAYSITQDEILIPILEESTRKLLICLDFQRKAFTPISLEVAFDGDYHTLFNVALKDQGFFTQITTNGSVKHLALENVTITSTEATAPIGALTGTNAGMLTDVHLKGTSIIQGGDSSEPAIATTIGGLIGTNTGAVNNLSVSGKLTINHKMADANEYHIGGMIGATSANLHHCVVSGAVKITSTGTTSKEAHIGGLVGTCQAIESTIEGTAPISRSVASTQTDASKATAAHLYVGGFAGSLVCRIADCSASGYTIGGTGTASAATGGFVGYVNHATDVEQYPNACSATGDVKASASAGNSYTGGFAGQSVVSLKNCSSVGRVTKSSLSTNQFTGGLIGMIAADKLIYNSFSMSEIYNNDNSLVEIAATANYDDATDARFCGLRPEAKTRNCHYQGWLLNTRGGNESKEVKASYLNNSVNDINRYLRWSSNANVYSGVPYLMYQQKPNN